MSIERQKRLEMVEVNSPLSQRRQCELLSIPRWSLYYKPATASAMNLHLMQIIDRQYTATPFYGVPRISNTMTAQWCVATIQEAFFQNDKPEIFNTDFTSDLYVELLKKRAGTDQHGW